MTETPLQDEARRARAALERVFMAHPDENGPAQWEYDIWIDSRLHLIVILALIVGIAIGAISAPFGFQ